MCAFVRHDARSAMGDNERYTANFARLATTLFLSLIEVVDTVRTGNAKIIMFFVRGAVTVFYVPTEHRFLIGKNPHNPILVSVFVAINLKLLFFHGAPLIYIY